MNSFGWPQWVTLVLMSISVFGRAFALAPDRQSAKWKGLANTAINVGCAGMYAGILHAGGFW